MLLGCTIKPMDDGEWYYRQARNANLNGARRAINYGCEFEDALDAIIELLQTVDVCYYCGESLKNKKKTIDHRVPLVRGGGHLARNLVVACYDCNQVKSGMSLLEFRQGFEQRYIASEVFGWEDYL